MTAIASNGAILKRGNNGAPEDYTAVAGVLSVSGPSQTTNELDVTPLSSTDREFIAGLSEAGTVSMELSYDYSEYNTFCTHQENGTFRMYQFALPDGHTLTWSGVPLSVSLDSASGDFVKSSVELRISGPVTRA